MEEVVDADHNGLDVGVVHDKAVCHDDWGDREAILPQYWYSTFAVQFGAKAHLTAPAIQPPWGLDVLADRPLVKSETVASYPIPAATALGVEQPVVEPWAGEAEATCQRRDPGRIRVSLEEIATDRP